MHFPLWKSRQTSRPLLPPPPLPLTPLPLPLLAARLPLPFPAADGAVSFAFAAFIAATFPADIEAEGGANGAGADGGSCFAVSLFVDGEAALRLAGGAGAGAEAGGDVVCVPAAAFAEPDPASEE